MKRTPLTRAAALLTSLALVFGLAGTALGATKGPIDIEGGADGCPTIWHYEYKDSSGSDYFYTWSSSLQKYQKTKLSAPKGFCIDVSEHNGKLRWKKIKQSGIKYAIIRCGYGQDYAGQDDKQWARNVLYAKKYGIKIGVYLYSYAENETMAYGEALHTLRCLREAGLGPEDLDLPVYYDLEHANALPSSKSASTQLKLRREMLSRAAAVYCNTIAAEGYNVGIYSMASWFLEQNTSGYLVDPVFSDYGWSKWVAQYGTHCMICRPSITKPVVAMKNYGDYLDMWQFTSRGWIEGLPPKGENGIKRVDVSAIYNLDFDTAGVQVPIPGGTILYKLNGGTNAESNTSKYPQGGVLELANPTRKYYSFKGWYANGKKVESISKADYPAVTLTAKWEKNTYAIEYELNGGKNSSKNPSSAWTKNATTLAAPTRSGYTFEGWYTTPDFQEGSLVTSVKASKNKTVTVYAKWKVEDKYRIAYYLDGGTNNPANLAKVPVSQSLELAAPTRAGCTFLGWYGSKGFAEDSLITEPLQGEAGQKIKVYAKWKVKTYKLSYVLDKGTMPSSAPSSYKVTSQTFDLPLPTLKGYGFAGWYTKADLSGTPLFSILQGSTGTKKLYGAWVKGAYNAKVTASSLNVRAKASTSSAATGAVAHGQILCITKTNAAKTWGYVNKQGWVKLSYTQKL